MRKKQLIIILVLGVLFFSFYNANGQSAIKQTQSQEAEEDFATKVEKAGDEVEEQVDQYSSQLERVLDVIVEKYKKIKPKIQKIVSKIKEKQQEITEDKQVPQP